MRAINPYGRSKLSLKSTDLTTHQKEWMATVDVLDGKHSGAYWDARYYLPKNTSKNWANRMKDHDVILKQGRPPRLSTKEVTILHEFVKMENMICRQNPSMI